MNLYATPALVRGTLGDTDTSNDTLFLRILESVSRSIDRYCQRQFYIETEARTFDVPRRRFWIPDNLSITTLKLDPDGDQTFSETVDSGDYLLYPLNNWPKIRVAPAPLTTWWATILFPRSAIQITGDWGHGDGLVATPYVTSAITGTTADTTTTTLTISVSAGLDAGQTILMGSERMYVSAVSGTTATVERAINGTTGATHTDVAIAIYRYPADVVDVAIRATIRKAVRDAQAGANSMKIGAFAETYSATASGPETNSGLNAGEEDQLNLLKRFNSGC